jgi:hypothetical protein
MSCAAVEIVLLAIGILIDLQIDSWDDNRKDLEFARMPPPRSRTAWKNTKPRSRSSWPSKEPTTRAPEGRSRRRCSSVAAIGTKIAADLRT